ncbi:alanine racemase [Alkaliphilus hydrothermalis]|uniref:Alanine racemase n=1 Tax=Alkaliphilus hydrothermalis TaxID=1482730 RepID=A0ABS2NMX8_9FIRM|nr:alanine racemase [Alkaliphilus hydrothermalis]MBM7614262.1 alanine racemase [Alkaliphilus hydrothermalis]
MEGKKLLRPVWAEINLDHIKHNLNEVKRVTKKDTKICCVIKADGYGHGAVEISKTLKENGADCFAVATLTEAIQLRKGGVDLPILVLGYTPEEHGERILEHDLTQTVYSFQQARVFSETASKMTKMMKVHIKVDTGMSRLGFYPPEEAFNDIEAIFNLPNILVEGMYTHFATADEKDKTITRKQFDRYMKLAQQLEEAGYQIPIKHVSNSAAIIDLPEMNLDMVRAGIMLYGLYPSPEVSHENVKLKQVITLKLKVAQVKVLPADTGVSYGHIYKTPSTRQIITLPIGYADGFTRMLTSKAEVILKNEKIPVVGRICMDQAMADATGIDVEMGDEVTIIGNDPSIGNTVDEIAKKLGTINYEIVCMVGERIPRIYMENNNLLHVKDSLIE